MPYFSFSADLLHNVFVNSVDNFDIVHNTCTILVGDAAPP